MAVRETSPLPEPTAVEAFLYVMSQQETCDFLTKGLGFLQSVKGLLAGGSNAGSTNVDTRLAEEIMSALEGMATDAWPDRIFMMEAVVE